MCISRSRRCTRLRRGEFEQYIKDDRDFVRVMVKRAAEGMVIRYGEGAARLEGAALTKFMTQLNEYLGFFDKVNTRLRNEEVTNMLAHAELTKRVDFESVTKLQGLHKELEKIEKKYQFKGLQKPVQDEEHRTWSLCFVDAQGAERRIDWLLASTPEYRQMMSKHGQIRDLLEPPFVVEYAAKAVAVGVGVRTEEDAEETARRRRTVRRRRGSRLRSGRGRRIWSRWRSRRRGSCSST